MCIVHFVLYQLVKVTYVLVHVYQQYDGLSRSSSSKIFKGFSQHLPLWKMLSMILLLFRMDDCLDGYPALYFVKLGRLWTLKHFIHYKCPSFCPDTLRSGQRIVILWKAKCTSQRHEDPELMDWWRYNCCTISLVHSLFGRNTQSYHTKPLLIMIYGLNYGRQPPSK